MSRSNWHAGNYRYTRRHIDQILGNYARYTDPWGARADPAIGRLFRSSVPFDLERRSQRTRGESLSVPIRKSHVEPDWKQGNLREKCDIDMAVDCLGKTQWQAVLLGDVHYTKGFLKLPNPQRALLGPFVGVTDMELEADGWVQDVYRTRAYAYRKMLWFLNGKGEVHAHDI